MRRVTGLAAGAVIAATGLVLAACQQGGGSAAGASGTTGPSTTTTATGSAAPSQVVANAYQATIDTGSAKTTMTTQVGIGTTSLPVTASGDLDFAHRAADLTEQLPGGQATAETRFVGGLLYEHIPNATIQQLAGGKPWISLDLTKMSGQGQGSLQQLMTDTPADPTTMLGYLRGAGAQVTTVGQDTVDGAQTTHYQVVIDLDKAAQGQDDKSQQAIHTLEQQLGSHTLPAQVWIDGQNLLRKVTMQESLTGTPSVTPAAAAGTPVSFSFTAQLSDFGVPVTVTAPPADQTADLTNALSGGH